jgi:pimeloyl-ACP methyl ester carboxylesterase
MANAAVTVGSGEHRVLALHGWFGSARGWGPVPDYLNGDDYTWAFMDLRGYGSRKDVTGEFTMREAAAALVASIEGFLGQG